MAEDKEKSSANFADLLIESRKAGITVHFTGDRASFEIRNALQKASEDVAALIQANPVHAAHWDSIRNVRGYTVPPEDLGAYNAYMSELNRLGDIETAATAASIALRKDPILEQQRVDRILAASGGEKTVIVWGSNHAGKLNDFNEMLDARLREQSATRGGPAPTPTRVLELWHSRADRDEHGHMDGPDEPDARFYIEERDVEITASGATHVEMKPAPLSSGQSLGLSEYAALMERLTGSAAAPAPPPPERKVAAVTPKPEFTP